MLVSGRLQSRVWEKDGQKHNKVEVIAQDVTFLSYASQLDSMPHEKKDVVIDDISDEPIDLSAVPF